ncbi:ABC transporter substrate-binding protein [Streptomyces sp. BBFR51]|uniref:ABC transporter substrate-binding protein n=1 Tax=Streptomyces sp. BBFR51 TaxID=3372856 RepID=UPI0037DD41ED
MAPEPVLYPEPTEDGHAPGFPFIEKAGEAAEGRLCVTTYADAPRLPAARPFTTAYAERFPAAPPPGPAAPFALEAYDALLLVASALRRPSDGGPERGSTTARLRRARYGGLAKPIGFTSDTGEFERAAGLFLYRVERGSPVFLGNYRDLRGK